VGTVAGTPRPQGWDAQTIYNWLHKGKGPQSTTDTNYQQWDTVANGHVDVRDLIENALKNSKSTWEGQAADSAHGSISPLGEWADVTGSTANNVATTVAIQSGSFRDAQSKVDPPPNVPDKPWYNDYTPWDTDYDEAVEKRQNADNVAIQALTEYGNSTTTNMGTMPQFTAPSTMQVDVQQPGTGGPGGGGPGGGGGGGGYPGGGGGAPGYGGPGGGGGGGGSAPYGGGANVPGYHAPSGGDTNPSGWSPSDPTNPSGAGNWPSGTGPSGGNQYGNPGVYPGPGGSDRSGGPGGGPPGGFPGFGPGGFGGGEDEYRSGRGYGGGAGGAGGAAGRFGAGGGNLGAGAASGAAQEAAAGRGFGPGGAAAGRGGAAGGMGGPMGGRGGKGGEDAEHQRPGYLVETEDVFGDGQLVAPPVIGED
jgi:hypothetical protein